MSLHPRPHRAFLAAAPIVAALCLGFAARGTPAQNDDTASAGDRLKRHLGQFHCWGDLVETWRCRVHGRWMTYRPNPTRSGEFWGDLEYKAGRFRLTVDRRRGHTEPSTRWNRAITLLCRQAGLLPTGFPIPRGRVVERNGDDFAIDRDGRSVATFDFTRGRLTQFRTDGMRFDVASRWIGEDHLLLRSFTMRRARSIRPVAKVRYAYRRYAGTYFPRAITEERLGESLNLLFDLHEVHFAR